MPVIASLETQLATINPWLPLLAKVLLLAVCLRIGLYWLLFLRRAREGVRHFARNMFYVATALYLVVLGFWMVTHVPNGSATAPIWFGGGFVFLAAGLIELRKK